MSARSALLLPPSASPATERPPYGSPALVTSMGAAPDERFLSQAACAALAQRVARMAVGGGHTQVILDSSWSANVRWARNRIATSEDVRTTQISLQRELRGAVGHVSLNMLDDAALEAAVRRAERFLLMVHEDPGNWFNDLQYTEQYLNPTVWSDATYHLEAEARAAVACQVSQQAEQAGLLAAGYLAVGAGGSAVMNTRGRAMYYPSTSVQYTVTVRDPKGTGSGWAGVNHWDWTKIDTTAIAQRAIEKCLASRNPMALEPGRYTAILEPQAVYQLMARLFESQREQYEVAPGGFLGSGGTGPPPFWKSAGQSRIGEVVMDERLTFEQDPMDPELAHVPFGYGGTVYHAAQWVNRGVLMNLPYTLEYAMENLGKNQGLPSSGALRIRSSAPPVSLEEMIATTTRGLLVSHFDQVGFPVGDAMHAGGYTRDGLWLVENGKLGTPVKNFKFEDNPYSMLQPTRLEQIGAPVRVFTSYGWPVVVPPMKVKDFNFTQLTDAV